ncbi:putative phosphodiesterase I [Lupinus albus]|uniref:Putative phosphodiesterase I n=1 Tax=Lupinus albus TaxID=3870 RepID=A0A6A4PYT1_LUPAL|nr:putative phosphodiesterase I [Lupinus albus]
MCKIGYLVPVNRKLKEESSVCKLISIFDGSNVIGRNDIPFPFKVDNRISRKHLSLTSSHHSTSLHLLVEGTNPIVVHSGNKRRKLNSQEKATIFDGDIIELIPGHHFFKYQTTSSTQPIRHFHLPNHIIPSTFRLLSVQGLPLEANTSSLSIPDVIQGDIQIAILSNYMVDIHWLLSASPALSKVPHVLLIHGESDGRMEYMKRNRPANWILHKPPLPISFGTHHSKAMFLVYPRGVRVVVHTANLIHVDWNNKTQGLWMQDFPWKDQNSPSRGSGFENDLVEYLTALKWPEFSVKLPSLGNFSITPYFFKKFNYSDAMVRLIASVPGYHSGAGLKKWGHMKMRSLLQECTFDEEFKKSPLIYQFSSLGSLDEKWMAEFASSLSAGSCEDKTPLGMGEAQIIWPTIEDVRCSLEGYAAGSCIPSPLKNVEKAFLKKYWSKWKADHTGRSRAMPHIKTFTRYNGQNLAWFLLTSANLSKAAWGALQKNNTQLMIRSYELGVLFLPSLIKRRGCGFSCTSNVTLSEDKCKREESSEMKKTKLVTLCGMGRESRDWLPEEMIPFPVPYELPPQPYSPQDVPWSWDRQYSNKDVYGQVWPRM